MIAEYLLSPHSAIFRSVCIRQYQAVIPDDGDTAFEPESDAMTSKLWELWETVDADTRREFIRKVVDKRVEAG